MRVRQREREREGGREGEGVEVVCHSLIYDGKFILKHVVVVAAVNASREIAVGDWIDQTVFNNNVSIPNIFNPPLPP